MTTKKTDDYSKLLPEKLPREDDYSYSLFSTYCLLGTDRRLVKVATIVFGKTQPGETSIEKVSNRLKHLSSKFNWTDRAKIFDHNRLLDQTDKLIFEQQQIDKNWLDKGKKSRELLQKILSDAEKIRECNSLVIDAVLSRVKGENTLEALVAIQKIVLSAANSSLAISRILTDTWQIKLNAEVIAAAESEMLGIAEL